MVFMFLCFQNSETLVEKARYEEAAEKSMQLETKVGGEHNICYSVHRL